MGQIDLQKKWLPVVHFDTQKDAGEVPVLWVAIGLFDILKY